MAKMGTAEAPLPFVYVRSGVHHSLHHSPLITTTLLFSFYLTRLARYAFEISVCVNRHVVCENLFLWRSLFGQKRSLQTDP